ncbi:E3 ubiquitin-protein ligase MSL2-like [Artemia franciscana]|uniref:RING-type domain-containing protein n=1 Tax=Artemia franciscana TaxID=6661 RepID=A0AA88LB94_ARTSF|nr:hypothetical protein QYM36_005366 [Artemia franciscana]
MNASSLYVTSSRLVMMYDEDAANKLPKSLAKAAESKNNSILQDLFKLIPYLNQCLSCVVCDQLLTDPYSAKDSACQHYVCSTCVYGKRRSKSTCDSCRDSSNFVKDRQLNSLVLCFQQLCKCILAMPGLSGKIESAVSTSDCSSLIEIVKRAAQEESFPRQNDDLGLPRSVYSMLPSLFSPANIDRAKRKKASENIDTMIKHSTANVSHLKPGVPNYTVVRISEGKSTKITIKKRQQESAKKVSNMLASGINKAKEVCDEIIAAKTLKPKCRCGVATPLPGKLTCCGQRCTCYIEQKPCIGCKCRGCRNPYNKIIDSEKEQLSADSVIYRKGSDTGTKILQCDPQSSFKGNDSKTVGETIQYHYSTQVKGESSDLLLTNIEQFPAALLVDDEVLL